MHGREIATLRKLKKPCVVLVTEKYFQKYDFEGLTCQLATEDIAKGQKSQIVRVQGLTLAWAKKNKLKSGKTTLFSKVAGIDDKQDKLIFPAGATIKVRSLNSIIFDSSCRIVLDPILTTLILHLIARAKTWKHIRWSANSGEWDQNRVSSSC